MNFDAYNPSEKPVHIRSLKAGELDTGNHLIRVVLADDHARVRAGIRSMLDRTDDILVIGEASNGLEALQLIEELSPDVLVLDIEMPVMNGLQVAQKIQNQEIPVQVLVLSAYDDTEYISSMLENGVAGFLTKDEVPKLLFRAVRGVARGELGWVSSRVSDRIKTFDPNVDSRHMTLTSHEVEVLRLLAGKRTPREIADTLGLSEDNLNKHLSLLTEKFNAKSPVDLVVLARQAKVI